MTERGAFWHTAATITAGVLIVFGFFLYFAGRRLFEEPALLAIILIPALCLFPFIYRRYRDGRPQFTRQQHLKRAILWGAVAAVFLVVNVMDPKIGWRAASGWANVAGWIIAALENLYKAQKMKEEEEKELPIAS